MFWNSAGCAWATMLGRNAAVAKPSNAARLLVSTVGCCHAVTATENNKTITFSDSIVDAKVTSLVVENVRSPWMIGWLLIVDR